MIELRDARLTDSLPAIVGSQPWAKAMTTAVQMQFRRLIDLADRVQLYAAVPQMPDKVLDIMAHDLCVPEYLESFEIGVKRALIQGALTYWSKAGTKAAVEHLCRDIFGDATVIEWYEYDGNPGYFKVTTTNPTITVENVYHFRRAVESIKRLSAWLEKVELLLSIPSIQQNYGFTVHVATKHTMVQA